MNIVLVHSKTVPVLRCGGTELVFWDPARALVDLGHSISLLVPEGSQCDFARVVFDNERVISGETLEMGATSGSPSRGLAWTH